MHFVIVCLFLAQSGDYPALTRAYEELRAKSYEEAIHSFQEALQVSPKASTHLDLAYTLIKVGENEEAREHFRRAMLLEPANAAPALEYAFLTFEAEDHKLSNKAEARRIFDRWRKAGNATAERAFRNIDGPLAEGLARWLAAPESFSGDVEIAQLAEQKGENALAAAHYLAAWRIHPENKMLLVDLGRVSPDPVPALLAASRGGQPRAAEAARELLPARYPYVYEFEQALNLDPANGALHRELAYLLLQMGRTSDAEREFQALVKSDASDMLSTAQLGFLYLARKEKGPATALLQAVMAGGDENLAYRVRAVLATPPPPRQSEDRKSDVAPRSMAERSLRAGYLRDAIRFLEEAQEREPDDFSLMLKLGWTFNLLHEDSSAIRWFLKARESPDPKIASEAAVAYNALRPAVARFRTTAWFFPFFSTRWHDGLGYGQVKTELRIDRLSIRPYVSLRFIGDTGPPQAALSEKTFILGAGARASWHGVTGWAEAGRTVGFGRERDGADYRGGVSYSKTLGASFGSEKNGFFVEASGDEVFLSRFHNDWLTYAQTRGGYRLGPVQFLASANATVDTIGQYWANYVEFGPGVRIHARKWPDSLVISANAIRGVYLINQGNPRRPNFYDLRMGLWYAFTR